MALTAFIYKLRQMLVTLFALEAALAVSPHYMHALMIVHQVLPLTLHSDFAFMPRKITSSRVSVDNVVRPSD